MEMDIQKKKRSIKMVGEERDKDIDLDPFARWVFLGSMCLFFGFFLFLKHYGL